VAPRLELGVDPHVSSPFDPSVGHKGDMDNVCVPTDGGRGGQGVSHPAEEVEPLNKHLLCIAEHKASGEAGLELRRGESDQIANVESKKERRGVRGSREAWKGHLPLDLGRKQGIAGGVHDKAATGHHPHGCLFSP